MLIPKDNMRGCSIGDEDFKDYEGAMISPQLHKVKLSFICERETSNELDILIVTCLVTRKLEDKPMGDYILVSTCPIIGENVPLDCEIWHFSQFQFRLMASLLDRGTEVQRRTSKYIIAHPMTEMEFYESISPLVRSGKIQKSIFNLFENAAE